MHSFNDKMKTLTIIFILTILTVKNLSYLIKIPTEPVVEVNKIAPVGWIQLQKSLLPLFENICEESNDPTVIRKAQGFTFDATSGEYLNPDAITNLNKLKIGKGFLPRGEIFTEYNPDHMNELRIVYEAMYYAKNFDTFHKVAAWARQNLNCGMFVNAVYLAIQNRKDTEKLSLPAPYEVIPNYFIQKDVIFLASKLLASEEVSPSEGIHNDGNSYTLDANYTAIFYDNDEESKLAYFREDVGLNAYYFLRKLKEAPWLNDDINSRYGENMYQMMKQFMARYNLERYSNGLPDLNSIDWNFVSDIPYDPMLIYANGNEFPHRTGPKQFIDNDDVALLQTIENKLGEVVIHMRDGGYNKTQILNHLMEILVTGDRSYENLARKLLGKDQTDKGYPSVLEHYITSLRDPMFWIINKKMVEMVDNALQTIPSYTHNELIFPGVEIINIEVKKIMTVFDYYDFDVTDALKISDSNATFQVKIGQPRLNHKPFNIKVNISSLISNKGLVKIYLGPRIAPGELAVKKNNFVLLDMFEYNFKIGPNIITRTSDDMKQFSKDFMSLGTIRKTVQYVEFGLDSLPVHTVKSQFGYPDRLILPKGTFNGLPLQLFVFVAPFIKSFYGSSIRSTDAFNSALLSPGYPLDLTIDNKLLLGLPNAMLKDIIVTHKSDSKIENYGGSGITKKWYGTNTYDPSARMAKEEPFDYASKKGQYGNKGNNEFDIKKNNDQVNQDLNPLDKIEHIDKVVSVPESRYLLASKAGNTYLENKKEKQGSLNNNPSKDKFLTKPEENKLLQKDESSYNKDISKLPEEGGNEMGLQGITNYLLNDSNTNDMSTIGSVNRLLRGVVGFDYVAKKKERESKSYYKPSGQYGNKNEYYTKKENDKFDYEAKKDHYGKKSTKNNIQDLVLNNDDMTPEVSDHLISTDDILNSNNDNNKTTDSIKEIINPEENTPEINDIISPVNDIQEIKPSCKFGSPSLCKFSVYDYIVHVLHDDDLDEKVYE